jgi:two-component system cell cycle response regulator
MPLRREPDSDIELAASVEKRCAHLLVLSGPGVGDVHRLEPEETLIGRGESAAIRACHPTVSRRHARLVVRGERILIEDLGSRNGTFVGIRSVKHQRVVEDGDAIGFGQSTVMKVSYGCTARLSAVGQSWAQTTCRDHIVDRIAVEWALAKLKGAPLGLVFFRVDAIAGLADQAPGGLLANEMLGQLALGIFETMRGGDIVGRCGADSFIAVARSDAASAAEVADQVRARVSRRLASSPQSVDQSTITAAVLPLSIDDSADPSEVVAAATRAARHALEGRRDRVVALAQLGPVRQRWR